MPLLCARRQWGHHNGRVQGIKRSPSPRAAGLKREGTYMQHRVVGPFSDLFHITLGETSPSNYEPWYIRGRAVVGEQPASGKRKSTKYRAVLQARRGTGMHVLPTSYCPSNGIHVSLSTPHTSAESGSTFSALTDGELAEPSVVICYKACMRVG